MEIGGGNFNSHTIEIFGIQMIHKMKVKENLAKKSSYKVVNFQNTRFYLKKKKKDKQKPKKPQKTPLSQL